MMDDYKIIVEQEHSTVMAHYDIPKKDSEGYQSEAKLEAAFIKQLQGQGYEYARQVKDERSLLKNLRQQLELREILTKENIVLIFDECHRSQFGDMHKLIVKRVKKYLMFGFTGTPIFAVNTSAGSKYSTTAQLFGGELDKDGKPTKALHTYTIINAIRDKNVLRFHVDYNRTMRMKDDVERKQVWGIDTDEALHNPQRISIVTRYILDNFAEKTKKGKFNSILAVDSVKTAIMYYQEFKKQMKEPGMPPLRIATIYTFNDQSAQ